MDKALHMQKAAGFKSARLTVSSVRHFWHDCANEGTPYNRLVALWSQHQVLQLYSLPTFL